MLQLRADGMSNRRIAASLGTSAMAAGGLLRQVLWSPAIEYASMNGGSAVAYLNVHFGA